MRVASLLALIVLSTSPMAQAATSVGVTLTLKERVSVSGDAIRLGDVAEVQTASHDLQQTMSALKVGDAPGLTPRIVSRESLATAIRRVLPRQNLTWAGAMRVIVERPQQRHDGASLAIVAREFLARQLSELDPAVTRFEIELQGRLDDVNVPAGLVSVTPQPIRGRSMTKRMCVWLDVAVDGRTYRHLAVWFSVKAVRPVWVADRTLTVRENLMPADMHVEERDIADGAGAPYSPGETAGYQRTLHAITRGKIILRNDVEPAPAIARNQEVEVQVDAGTVRIETKAVAEADGRVGEQISLRNPSSDERFQALVTGTGRARVYVR